MVQVQYDYDTVVGMRCSLLVLVLGLASCITTTLKSGRQHLEEGDLALSAGDYNKAEAEYSTARYRADGSAWVEDQGQRGIAKVGIARIRARVPELRKLATPPADAIAEVTNVRTSLRGLGGDAELDAQLVIVLGEHAERWVLAEEQRALAGDAFPAAHAVTPLLALRDLPGSIVARASKLREDAGKVALRRAASAGASHPIAQRLHQGHAAALGGPPVADGTSLLAPYARSVVVELGAPDGCALAALKPALARPGSRRLATVQVTITACATSSSTTTSDEEATWTEQVLAGYDTELVPEQVCETKCGSVLTGSEVCTTSYQYSPPMQVCTPNTLEKCFDECRTVQVPRQVPRYRAEPRSAPRTLTTETTTATATGTWKVTRDGAERSGTFSINERNEYAWAPALAGAAPKVVGTKRTEADVAAWAYQSAARTLQAALDELFAADVAEAVASAQAAAGSIDDEEEHWARAVLLGGADLGPIASRYDLDKGRFLGLFAAQRFEPTLIEDLPAPRTFDDVPRDDEGGRVLEQDYRVLEAMKLPSYGGRYSLQVEAGLRSLPTVMTSSGSEAGGDSAFLVGVRAATHALGALLRTSYWGGQVVDELSGAIALGSRIGGPTVVDNSVSFAAATFGVNYALGGGYRRPGRGALFAGVRASYEAFLIGTSTGSYATAPLFVRAEAPLVHGTVAAEVTGVSLLGSASYGLSLHWANRRRSTSERGKYAQVRIEHTTVDATSTDFGDPAAMNGDRQLTDVGLTTVMVLYGRGW